MKNNSTSRKSLIDRTNYKRLATMTDAEIDFSDNPEVPAEMFARGVVRRGLKPIAPKKQLTLRIDSDVVDWYKKQGRGYQTRINSLLRAYMQAHQRRRA